MSDLIEREAVIAGLANIAKQTARSNAQKAMMGRSMFFVERLPSATPAPKTGRWIETGYDGYADGNPVIDEWECSECGWEHIGEDGSLTRYCPDCGAKMENAAE